ncbi:hypothetical protein FGADI_5417 [Fusarium gaditjirri]|uniref:Uncharacterized protein n=1 Tax=Fusarium gaditjirri TaxID=282569 RepID=A0A8H4TAC7_9HYPO|nr:hypothetical protein FGADI_5417 [Fusarium gaditjirri]
MKHQLPTIPYRNMYPQALVALGFPAVVTVVGFLLSYCMAPVMKEKPWIETGFPVQQTELWRIRVYLVHHSLHIRDPYSPARPLHAVPKLDANEKPFHPAQLSASPDQRLHRAVHRTIADSFLEETESTVQAMAENLANLNEADVDRDWAYTAMSVVSILSDDAIRGHYAHWFVPQLTAGFADMIKTDEAIRNARLEALKMLYTQSQRRRDDYKASVSRATTSWRKATLGQQNTGPSARNEPVMLTPRPDMVNRRTLSTPPKLPDSIGSWILREPRASRRNDQESQGIHTSPPPETGSGQLEATVTHPNPQRRFATMPQDSVTAPMPMNQSLNEGRKSRQSRHDTHQRPYLPPGLPLVQWYVEHRRANRRITVRRVKEPETPGTQHGNEGAKNEVSDPDSSSGINDKARYRWSKSKSQRRPKSRFRARSRRRHESSSESSSSSDEVSRKSRHRGSKARHRQSNNRKSTDKNRDDDEENDHNDKKKSQGRHSLRSKHYKDEETELEDLEREFTKSKRRDKSLRGDHQNGRHGGRKWGHGNAKDDAK